MCHSHGRLTTRLFTNETEHLVKYRSRANIWTANFLGRWGSVLSAHFRQPESWAQLHSAKASTTGKSPLCAKSPIGLTKTPSGLGASEVALNPTLQNETGSEREVFWPVTEQGSRRLGLESRLPHTVTGLNAASDSG